MSSSLGRPCYKNWVQRLDVSAHTCGCYDLLVYLDYDTCQSGFLHKGLKKKKEPWLCLAGRSLAPVVDRRSSFKPQLLVHSTPYWLKWPVPNTTNLQQVHFHFLEVVTPEMYTLIASGYVFHAVGWVSLDQAGRSDPNTATPAIRWLADSQKRPNHPRSEPLKASYQSCQATAFVF